MTEDEFRRAVMMRFDRIDGRMDAIHARLEESETRFDDLNRRFGAMEDRIAGLEKAVAYVAKNTELALDRIRLVGRRVDDLENPGGTNRPG